jgi:hypothetical protein
MKKHLFFFVVTLAVFFASCQPEPDAKLLVDDLIVATNYDTAANFNGYVTYSIPTDTIGFFSETSEDTIITASESDFPKPILSAIRSNLNALGYTEVDRTQDPDLGMNVVVVNDFNVFQEIVYPNYGYPGNYYPGYYGYGSYYYYPYINTYAYNTGVLIIEMVDLRNRTPDNKVKVIWDAYMGDVYSTLDLVPQTVRAIDQAFVQSPYVHRTSN